MEGLGAIWQPYARVNLWRYFNATSHVTFGGTTVIPALSSATIADVTAGVAVNVNGARRTTVGGDAGVRWRG
jgi:hypothetical protein